MDTGRGYDAEDELHEGVRSVADDEAFGLDACVVGECFDEVHLHGFGIARPRFVADGAQDVVFQAVGYVKRAFVLVELDGTVVGGEMIPVQGADFGFYVLEIGHGFWDPSPGPSPRRGGET